MKKPNNNMKIKEIKIKDKIKYKAIDKVYGRAEFQICPVFKYGYLKEIFIYRLQQNKDEAFHLDLKKNCLIGK